jgi:molybdopterin molybdotransferase
MAWSGKSTVSGTKIPWPREDVLACTVVVAEKAMPVGEFFLLKGYIIGDIFHRMESFFKVKTPKEVHEIVDTFGPSGTEIVFLEDALGRVLSRDIISPEDLPGFFRSAMDGYAVRAKDSFGASESLPGLFEVKGEVFMGETPATAVGRGQAVKISTGGMLPEGADAVVMIEYCHLLDEKTLEVSRAISPLENVIQPGDDFKKGSTVLKTGRRLKPHDLGLLAGLGQSEVPVYKRPRVAILSTGDEIVAIDARPGPGQVRDINRYSLGAFCGRMGAEYVYSGLCPDRFEPLKGGVEAGLSHGDTVWVSGGSSVGTRDLTLRVFETLPDFELLVHGISISPGKPTIIGRSGSRAVIGLPGHVASALVVAEVFLTRLILRLSGQPGPLERLHPVVEAQLSQNIESASGREDYIRVKLVKEGDRLMAEPIFGKSGLISTLVASDGLLRIEMNTEGLYQGDWVQVLLLNGGAP